MRLLLDTHVLIWWLEDNPRLGQRARDLIADARVNVLFSAASCWETSLKARKGKIAVGGSLLWRFAVEEGLEALGIDNNHIVEMEQLPKISGHGDPFDLLLLAQTKVIGASLMTGDRHMTRYGVPCVGVR